jgi:hypothetical protein
MAVIDETHSTPFDDHYWLFKENVSAMTALAPTGPNNWSQQVEGW